jgi:hypothetical protein
MCSELLGVVCLVDDLSYTDHLALVVTDWHGEYQIRFIASAQVYLAVEPGILKQKQTSRPLAYIPYIATFSTEQSSRGTYSHSAGQEVTLLQEIISSQLAKKLLALTKKFITVNTVTHH